MGKSETSLITLIALGIVFVLLAVGKSLIEWEWWTFLLVLAGMAFTVALVLFVVQSILRSARS